MEGKKKKQQRGRKIQSLIFLSRDIVKYYLTEVYSMKNMLNLGKHSKADHKSVYLD